MRVAEPSPVTKGVLTHGTNALIAKFGDVIDLGGKIEMLIKDENLRNAIAIEARHELEKRYSWAVLRPSAQQIISKEKL